MTRYAVIHRSALNSIDQFTKLGGKELETGGALFGFDNGSKVSITAACGPGADAKRGPQSFLRDLKHTQKFAREIFTSSGAQWIGEWHTHPCGPSQPSERDIRTYVAHLLDRELAFHAFIALIIVPESGIEAVDKLHVWCLENLAGHISLNEVQPQIGEPHHDRTI